MNRLERKAVDRARHHLARHMRAGEQILDFNIAELVARGRDRVDLVATDLAAYFVDSRFREVTRFPYEEIAVVFWDDLPSMRRHLSLELTNQQRITLRLRRGSRDFGAVIKRMVAGQILFEREVQFDSTRSATFRLRRLAEGRDPEWLVDFDRELDSRAPDVDAWVKRTIKELGTETGQMAPPPEQDSARAFVEAMADTTARDPELAAFVKRVTTGERLGGVVEARYRELMSEQVRSWGEEVYGRPIVTDQDLYPIHALVMTQLNDWLWGLEERELDFEQEVQLLCWFEIDSGGDSQSAAAGDAVAIVINRRRELGGSIPKFMPDPDKPS